MKFDAKAVSAIGAAACAVLLFGPPTAAAEPVPPPLPEPAPLAGPVAPDPLAAPAPPGPDAAVQPAAAGVTVPAEGVPHLVSPENLPPGTSDAPTTPSQPRLTYLRDLWHAMQTQEVSGSDALLLLTQRPMTANATPPPGLPPGPQPVAPAAPDAPAVPLPVAP